MQKQEPTGCGSGMGRKFRHYANAGVRFEDFPRMYWYIPVLFVYLLSFRPRAPSLRTHSETPSIGTFVRHPFGRLQAPDFTRNSLCSSTCAQEETRIDMFILLHTTSPASAMLCNLVCSWGGAFLPSPRNSVVLLEGLVVQAC